MYPSWRFGSRLKRVSERASRSRIGHGQGLRAAQDSTLAGSSYSWPDKPDAAAQGARSCFGLEQTPLPGVENLSFFRAHICFLNNLSIPTYPSITSHLSISSTTLPSTAIVLLYALESMSTHLCRVMFQLESSLSQCRH